MYRAQNESVLLMCDMKLQQQLSGAQNSALTQSKQRLQCSL